MNRSPTPWRDEMRATLALAWPLVLTNLAQAAIHATDVILLGRLGARQLAAGALGTNLMMACVVIGSGLVMAASPMIAKAVGARFNAVRDVRRTVRQTMWAAVAVVVPLWLLLWQGERVLLLLGQEPALAADGGHFLRAMMWGLLPYMFYLVLRVFVAALERPAWSLVIAVGGVIANAVINYGLVLGGFGMPQLGLVGAGLGSTIANSLMFVGLATVVSVHPRFRRFHLFGHFWRADWPRFRAVWRLGLPIAITLGLEVTVFNAAMFLMGLLGQDPLAAHAIAIQIASVTFMVPLGLAQAATVRVGLAVGRRDRIAMGRAGWTAWAMGVGFMGLTAILMITAPRLLIGIFLDAHNPANAEVVRLAISYLALAALFQIVDGAQAVGAGMLRGLHDTTVPMLFALVGYWLIGLAFGAWLAFHAGWAGVGIWTGLALGLAIVAVLMTARWALRERIGLVDAGPAVSRSTGGR
ncbi:MATE family efflux transporter [Sphingomonas fennica]|uniref:MATE family efflux transporter n=1 Tax=Edaphosphingomonas fennica TaxID=114404 RepID=A0A2T4I1Q4_9SPHN|nr:MATE family efflux transporter [Sphingomonas fennica]PTD22921.1 MATE family efflux transporter [Sphingomonas fennica]